MTLISIAFLWNITIVYINSMQVHFGTDVSIIEAQKADKHTYVVEFAGKRFVFDTTPITDTLENAENYYTALPVGLRMLTALIGAADNISSIFTLNYN